jgi:hypothetical protein
MLKPRFLIRKVAATVLELADASNAGCTALRCRDVKLCPTAGNGSWCCIGLFEVRNVEFNQVAKFLSLPVLMSENLFSVT